MEPRWAVAHGLPRLRREFRLKAVVSVRDTISQRKNKRPGLSWREPRPFCLVTYVARRGS